MFRGEEALENFADQSNNSGIMHGSFSELLRLRGSEYFNALDVLNRVYGTV